MPDSPADRERDPHDLEPRVRSLEVSVARLEQIAAITDRRLDEILVQLREMRGEFQAELREVRGEFRAEIRDLRADLRTQLNIMMGGFGLMLTAYLALLATVGRAVHWW